MTDKNKRILIVEDEPLLCQLYQMKLAALGYQVTVAHNGMEGYHKALKSIPDLILLDILMPKVDGYQMLKMLRQKDQTKYIPVIIMTNTPSLPNAREFQNLGIIKAFFKADITPSQLVLFIQNHFLGKT